MFTGIITDIGEIISKRDGVGADLRFDIKTSYAMETIDIGASIACSGCCLTVIEKGDNWFGVEVSNESLDKTNLGDWKEGHKVNLERSLKAGDELGGHIVSGHVDGLAEIIKIQEDEGSHRLTIKVPDSYKKFIASKGSIALDGISLTVNEVNDNRFGVNIIPHTWDVTTLGDAKPGTKLNFEIDPLARYMERMLQVQNDTK